MKYVRNSRLLYSASALILLLAAYLYFGTGIGKHGTGTASVAIGDQQMRLSGPYSHENLAVYLIHAPTQDRRSFITLNEGLESGVVVVAEQPNANVNELVIENKSDDYLFLQEGDLLKGGQQDRTIYASTIVVPHSGPQPVKAFCVEPGRWTAGVRGRAFANTGNPVLAPKEVRQAARYSDNQSEVWAQVARYSGNASFNEVGDSEQVKNILSKWANKFQYVMDLSPDSVGVAIVVNGQVEEVNVYPNKQVLEKQFSRLIGYYAVKAALHKNEAKAALAPDEVAQWMILNKQDAQIGEQPRPIDARNAFSVQQQADKVKSTTYFEGAVVHQQYMSRDNPLASQPGGSGFGTVGRSIGCTVGGGR